MLSSASSVEVAWRARWWGEIPNVKDWSLESPAGLGFKGSRGGRSDFGKSCLDLPSSIAGYMVDLTMEDAASLDVTTKGVGG